MVLLMVRAGLFGDLTHAACAYNHDLRTSVLDGGRRPIAAAKTSSATATCYPTHGLGPVAHYMDINRGDRFDYMVSMSSVVVAPGVSPGKDPGG